MARIRTIKPEFWTNEKLSSLSEIAHMTAAALLNYADDAGYFNANPGLIKAALFPLREPSRSVPVVLQELSSVDFLRLGKGPDGREYGQIVHFTDHQTINKPSASKIKDLPIKWNDSGSAPVVLLEDYREEQGTGNREQGTGNRERKKSRGESSVPRAARMEHDSLPEDWRAFCVKDRPDLDPDATFDRFRDYWIAQPGAKGRKTNWIATWRNWCRNERSGPARKMTTAEIAAQAMREMEARDAA